MLKYLTTKVSIALVHNWNTKQSDVVISVEDLASIMDLAPDVMIVRRLLVRDIPLKQLMQIGRKDLTLHLLAFKASDYALREQGVDVVALS